MGKVIAIEHLSLDGVMQAPGGVDEDPRDGFDQGGWAAQRGQDPRLQGAMGEYMSGDWSLLLGRRTYVQFAGFWPKLDDNPFSKALTEARKYVVSSTLTEPLPWENSELLKGEVAGSVGTLKERVDGNLVTMGSGDVVRALLPHRLVDVLLLAVHPVVLGSGRRLFPESGPGPENLRLLGNVTTDSGVVVSTYAPE
ncbi:dihydrofolate reductase family protein [Nocardiopsis suaedae]|uniref:Dihydrofolate reductase family protein n=1 Tax=Nocardiopsis suaedae TaxID=3018444 RepID=A0ABT4TE15_9ACTN|nr:dihydrofolate reductase family protein [Nocardiopsis suaedae]MDA2802938.1 dihydrofolate reductase family protein [Nocardiopsis suaedae]